MDSFNHIKCVAVIGAGPAGLAAVKYLKAENYFDTIVAFEQRSEIGGVWNYSGNVSRPDQSDLTIPRTEPASTVERPCSKNDVNGKGGNVFPSPVYDSLETNIPHTLMNFSDKPFPQNCPLFPDYRTVKRYLEKYAEEIRDHFRLGSQVVQVWPVEGEGNDLPRWRVLYIEQASETNHEQTFDAVVCASGHYSDPFVPNIRGIAEFSMSHPGIISHSKYYRRPDKYAKKKVVVVGNSASGVDISNQISTVAARVIVSEKEKPTSIHNGSMSITYRPEISEFTSQDRAVRFVDGHIETDIDSILFCTGYQYSFPFLRGLMYPVVTTGERTNFTYQHIFYYLQPTLAFLTLPQRIVPFPVAEAQSAYMARVFSGRITLPILQEMEAWEDGIIQAKDHGKGFHNLGFPEDGQYFNKLYELSMSATIRLSGGLSNEGQGKLPPFWDEEKQWTRQRFPMIKQAALKLGDKRREVRCLRDLGFDFEKWKDEQRMGEDSTVWILSSMNDPKSGKSVFLK